MNLYGWSKHLFDLAVVDRYVKKEKMPPHWVGLKFFNVYRPERIPQGPHGERAGQGVRRRQGGPTGAAVQVAP